MSAVCKLVPIFLVLSLLAVTAQGKTQNVAVLLGEHYDDGSEMAQQIVSEYLGSQMCRKNCYRMEERELLNSFEDFRSAWVARMVDVVITQLGLDQQSARVVRQNPSSFMINYETFKLLTFQ